MKIHNRKTKKDEDLTELHPETVLDLELSSTGKHIIRAMDANLDLVPGIQRIQIMAKEVLALEPLIEQEPEKIDEAKKRVEGDLKAFERETRNNPKYNTQTREKLEETVLREVDLYRWNHKKYWPAQFVKDNRRPPNLITKLVISKIGDVRSTPQNRLDMDMVKNQQFQEMFMKFMEQQTKVIETLTTKVDKSEDKK